MSTCCPRRRSRGGCGRVSHATNSARTPPVASGWTNATSSPKRPRRGALVDQLDALARASRSSSRRRRRPRRRRGASRPALGEELPDRRVGPSGASSSTRLVADPQRRGLDALVVDRLAVLDLSAEQRGSARPPRRGRRPRPRVVDPRRPRGRMLSDQDRWFVSRRGRERRRRTRRSATRARRREHLGSSRGSASRARAARPRPDRGNAVLGSIRSAST